MFFVWKICSWHSLPIILYVSTNLRCGEHTAAQLSSHKVGTYAFGFSSLRRMTNAPSYLPSSTARANAGSTSSCHQDHGSSRRRGATGAANQNRGQTENSELVAGATQPQTRQSRVGVVVGLTAKGGRVLTLEGQRHQNPMSVRQRCLRGSDKQRQWVRRAVGSTGRVG